MKVGKWSWVVPTIVLLAGCAAPGTVRLYDGEARQPAEVALISAPEQVQVMALDGVEQSISGVAARRACLDAALCSVVPD